MHRFACLLVLSLGMIFSSFAETEAHSFQPFTGRVVRNKVRLRMQPSLDGPILRELNKEDLVVVLGETEEFFAVKAPTDMKAYVFRTFVLDHVIEGNHVNVRLEPELEATILTQVNSGDRIDGEISPLNSKWYEIKIPEKVRLYIAKDYIEKVGDEKMMASMEGRRQEVNRLLNQAYKMEEGEFAKPFLSIHLEDLERLLHRITQEYNDFPNQTARANELLAMIQDRYLQAKIVFLENKPAPVPARGGEGEEQEEETKPLPPKTVQPPQKVEMATNAFKPISEGSKWDTQEQNHYLAWKSVHSDEPSTMDDFYLEEEKNSLVLRGTLESYDRPIKNRPGDFILLSQATGQPIAYLYGTAVDLGSRVKQVVTIKVVSRPNFHFAYPAFLVLEIE